MKQIKQTGGDSSALFQEAPSESCCRSGPSNGPRPILCPPKEMYAQSSVGHCCLGLESVGPMSNPTEMYTQISVDLRCLGLDSDGPLYFPLYTNTPFLNLCGMSCHRLTLCSPSECSFVAVCTVHRARAPEPLAISSQATDSTMSSGVDFSYSHSAEDQSEDGFGEDPAELAADQESDGAHQN
eukprot:1535468-Amphidinium_carterae.1